MARANLNFLQRLQFAVRRGMDHLGMPVNFSGPEGHHRKKSFAKDVIRWQQLHALAELFRIEVEQVEVFVEESGALPSLEKPWHRPSRFDGVGTPMGEFDRKTLYAAVRAVKPNVVVETGTAAGAFSTFVLAAMEKNGHGQMHSIDSSDASENVGILIPEELRGRVCFHSGDSLTLLPTLLRKIGPIDFFIHDSHHTYAHMMAEYELALQHLQPGGVISSHDVLYCNAWQHFIRKHGISRAQAVRNLGFCIVDQPIAHR